MHGMLLKHGAGHHLLVLVLLMAMLFMGNSLPGQWWRREHSSTLQAFRQQWMTSAHGQTDTSGFASLGAVSSVSRKALICSVLFLKYIGCVPKAASSAAKQSASSGSRNGQTHKKSRGQCSRPEATQLQQNTHTQSQGSLT